MTSWFRRIDLLVADDPNPHLDHWQAQQPCKVTKLGGREWVLNQPMSSFLVYFLGVQTCYAGAVIWAWPADNITAFWWSVSLWLWGLGAIFAGTSYQLFAYELKCRGQFQAKWTSWWEVIYLLAQQCSVNAMLAGMAFSATEGWIQQGLITLALLLSVTYLAFWCYGAFKPERQFISFDFMVLFSAPVFLLMLAVNGWQYIQHGQEINRVYSLIWIGLFLSMAAYYFWHDKGLTQALWRRGLWFSDNDILHVTLIAWMFYIIYMLPSLIV